MFPSDRLLGDSQRYLREVIRQKAKHRHKMERLSFTAKIRILDEMMARPPLVLVTPITEEHAELNQAVYNELIHIARQGAVTTYAGITALADLDLSPAGRTRIAQLLRTISTYEYQQGRPLLSALVVFKDSGLPGAGFFTLAHGLSFFSTGNRPEFWNQEVSKVHAQWKPNT